ncbi:MAG: hypothetical protein LR008_03545 [Candidatus Pacebacteria bacterium]|nr:hypothetical protein [Candidatus Paceibacterota bacterium]
MKRPILIIVGAILVFILIIVWLYVLFFSSPKEDTDSFTDFDLANTEDVSFSAGEGGDYSNLPTVDVSDIQKLRQLTTRNTIGYQEVLGDKDSSAKVFYVEAGTGHIFSIDLVSGEESRVSKTTIPHSKKAAITPDGTYVLMQSKQGPRSYVVIAQLSSTTDEMILGDNIENIIDFTETVDNTFLYTIQNTDSVTVNEHNPETSDTETLFTIPFRAVSIDWGSSASATHLFYPKTSSRLDGFLYQAKEGKVERLPIDGYGLSASGNGSFITYSKQTSQQYESFIYNQGLRESNSFGLDMIPEKCVFSDTSSSSVCAISLENLGADSPDSWYRGEVSYSDDLWEINNEIFSATLLVDTLFESGRELDIVNLSLGDQDESVYFINKNDSTLWVYERASN